jgi:hypothetical protein
MSSIFSQQTPPADGKTGETATISGGGPAVAPHNKRLL